jgi:hypothetical protein
VHDEAHVVSNSRAMPRGSAQVDFTDICGHPGVHDEADGAAIDAGGPTKTIRSLVSMSVSTAWTASEFVSPVS